MKNETEHSIRLTSPEIASLWTLYQSDTMAVVVLKYMLGKVEDQQIKPVFKDALTLAGEHVQTIDSLFKQENWPTPVGFSDQDVNLAAPRLFSDVYWLKYLHVMAIHGLTGYAVALTTATRADSRKYFTECNRESTELYNKSIDVLLSKGVFQRPPYVSTPAHAEFVKKQSFLNGWFGDRRPLNSVEVSNIYFNLNKDIVSRALQLGFSQTAQSREVRDFMIRGAEMSLKHINVFSSILQKNDLPSAQRLESEITNCTVPPFSDKLIMFHTQLLVAAAVAFYGAGMAACMRRDLAVHYQRVITETQLYLEDGANILIKNGWMEQVPQMDDREALTQIR
jgi:Protein of unknown function (DUF3231).